MTKKATGNNVYGLKQRLKSRKLESLVIKETSYSEKLFLEFSPTHNHTVPKAVLQ